MATRLEYKLRTDYAKLIQQVDRFESQIDLETLDWELKTKLISLKHDIEAVRDLVKVGDLQI